MTRLHRMLINAWPTLLFFAIVGALCVWQGAQWPTQWHIDPVPLTPAQLELVRSGHAPQTMGQQDFLILVVVVMFVLNKATTILRNLDFVDWFAISLMASNVVFALLYLLFITGVLFPYFFATHPTEAEWMRTSLRIVLVVVLVVSYLILNNVPRVDAKPVPRWETIIALYSLVAFIGVVAVIVWQP